MLKKIVKRIIFIFVFFTLLFSCTGVFAKEKVNVYIFTGEDCSFCENAKLGLESLKENYGEYFDVIEYETFNNEENNKLMKKVASFFKEDVEGVPYIVIGSKTMKGYHDDYLDDIKNYIIEAYLSEDGYDVMKKMNEVSTNTSDSTDFTVIILIVGVTIILTSILIVKSNKFKNNKEGKENFKKLCIGIAGIYILFISIVFSLSIKKDYDVPVSNKEEKELKEEKEDSSVKGELYKYDIEKLDYSIFKTKFYEIHYSGGTGDDYVSGEGHYQLNNDNTCFTTQKKSIGLYGLTYTVLNSTECNYQISDNTFTVNMKIHSITHYNGMDDSKDEEFTVNGEFLENYKYLMIGNMKYSSAHYNTYLEKNMEYVLIDPITTSDYTLDGVSLGNSDNRIDVSKYKIIDKTK